MEAVIREASPEPRPILFIDEIHLLLYLLDTRSRT